MTLEPGTRLGPYEILSAIGAGGMGEVYRARDTRLDRHLALKLLPARFATDPDRLRRFELEAKTVSALNHPNILTIYDVGESDGRPFLATELVDGETLRQRLLQARFSLGEALDIALQIGGALVAAHAASIVHRDLKPENVMVRRDGLVKVLDFGLAKLAERQSLADTVSPTRAIAVTDPGTVLGTASYMSPEQARGLDVDERSDIFSLGVMVYEMIAGRGPFERDTVSDSMAAILMVTPPAMPSDVPELAPDVERVVSKALRKDRDERYQGIRDMVVDLKAIKQDWDLRAKRGDRTTPAPAAPDQSRPKRKKKSGSTSVARPPASGSGGVRRAAKPPSAKARAAEAAAASSGFRWHWPIAAAVVAGVAAAVFWYVQATRVPALTARDAIVLSDFVNTTGEEVFDGTLKQGLAVSLEQSPYLQIYSDDRVRDTLRLMGRSPDERVTRAVAREICQRENLKALLAGSISRLGSSYVIALDAINGQNGDVIAHEQAEAATKEQVLESLGASASRLRGKLGESLASIQKFDAPLEQVTTTSLEALKAFSLARGLGMKGQQIEAVAMFKQAVDLDPNFAGAYASLAIYYSNTGQQELSSQAAKRAFALRERASQRERLRIDATYYGASGETDKVLEAMQLYVTSYPQDSTMLNNLGLLYINLGQVENGVRSLSEAIRLGSKAYQPYANLARAFVRLNRFDEAKTLLGTALAQGFEASAMHVLLFDIAAMEGDEAAMARELTWIGARPDAYAGLNAQARFAASRGRLRSSEELAIRAVDLAERSGFKEVAGSYAIFMAQRLAIVGDCASARRWVTRVLALARDRSTLEVVGLVRGLCGDAAAVEAVAAEIAERWPKANISNGVWAPAMRAAVAIDTRPADAVRLLESARPYERAASFWPSYLRGQAYLRQRQGAEATREFQRILDHRGEEVLSVLYPLAHVGKARAAALTGDIATSRKSFEDFFAAWKDADADLPILVAAKREYQALSRP